MTKPAYKKFEIGDYVQATEAYLRKTFNRAKLKTRLRFGVVVGFGRRLEHVRIVRPGCKNAQTFHMDYWEPINVKKPRFIKLPELHPRTKAVVRKPKERKLKVEPKYVTKEERMKAAGIKGFYWRGTWRHW